ncbi:MAG: DUF885 domain-containing protein [Methanobacteriota archaeon]|nr:MAG: DUF885 domain-containing protein [Euryarchaeota archaeon]
MGGRDFEDLCRSITDEILSWDPSYSTQLGWRKHDHLMMDPRKEAFDHQSARLSEFMVSLGGFAEEGLSAEQVIDRDLAIYLFRLRKFEITRLRIHEQMSIAEEEIGRSLFFLLVRDHPPFEERMEAITARLERTPEFLDRAKTVLTRPCQAWNEFALRTGEELPVFLETVLQTGRSKLESDEHIMRLSSAVEECLEAVVSHEEWLRDEVLPNAAPENAITPEDFDDYLHLKGLDVTADEALRIAEVGLEAANRQRTELAKAIAPSGEFTEAVKMMKDDRPSTFPETLKSYRQAILDAREFARARGLVSIPESEKLLVIETPRFMRHLAPLAAQYEPGKYTPDMTGFFLVTHDESNPGLMREHCHAAIVNTAVHESYPGHHLQGICANQNPSHIRSLSAAPCFVEGWALYCEKMMSAEGFGSAPLLKLAQLNDLVFRIARVRADVSLAKGTMTPKDVAALLTEETGMDEHAALDEAIGYTYSITTYLSYFIGMLRVLQLREDVERALGSHFRVKEFHDSLLNAGSLPVHFMRRVEALRLKKEFGVDLPEPEETLLRFLTRLVSQARPF